MKSTLMRQFLLACGITLAALGIGVGIAYACSIPVFRYALERWELTKYDVVVFHSGPLPDTLRKQLDRIDAGTVRANLKIETLDVDGKLSAKRAALWKKQQDPPLPWMVIRNPDTEDQARPFYAGPPDIDKIRPWLDSPSRRSLVQRLGKGDSAVFVLLESGDTAKDDKAAELLDAELQKLGNKLKLPELSKEGPQLKTDIPLKIAFSMLRVKRDDAQEDGMVRVLLATEEGLDQVKGPIVFPVFGRGRALCSLYEKDINKTQIANVSKFLCGECSCQVKELNPGVDLLITADWPAILEAAGPSRLIPQDIPAPKRKK
ncbi:MAG: hypothetical protein U0744_05530 [Gemmataceae bacterium]